MRITITPAGGKAFVLADEAAGAMVRDGFRPGQTRVTQSQALFRAPYKTNIPRFNLENRLRFVVERTFATVEAALNFMATHADQVPVQGTVTMYHLTARGQTSRSLASAVVLDIQCIEHIGVSCRFQYTIAGNSAWQ
jgi:hypothetical protein